VAEEVPRDAAGAAEVVDRHRVDPDRRPAGREGDDRDALREPRELVRGQASRHHGEPVDLRREHAHALVPVGRVRRREQDRVAPGAGRELRALHDLVRVEGGEPARLRVGLVEVAEDEADHAEPSPREPARGAVRHVAEPVERLPHAVAGLVGHAALLVHDARDRRDRDTRGARNVVDGHPSAHGFA
jgi:hypothetical protein